MQKTKVVGVTFEGRQGTIATINEMVDRLIAIREPENPYDENAIAVYVEKMNGERKSVGYINRGLAAQLAPEIDEGKELIIHDYFLTGAREQGISLGIIFAYTLEPSIEKVKSI
jgi:hypothetical protein